MYHVYETHRLGAGGVDGIARFGVWSAARTENGLLRLGAGRRREVAPLKRFGSVALTCARAFDRTRCAAQPNSARVIRHQASGLDLHTRCFRYSLGSRRQKQRSARRSPVGITRGVCGRHEQMTTAGHHPRTAAH